MLSCYLVEGTDGMATSIRFKVFNDNLSDYQASDVALGGLLLGEALQRGTA